MQTDSKLLVKVPRIILPPNKVIKFKPHYTRKTKHKNKGENSND